MHRARRAIATERFIKFRTFRLKEIKTNLRKLAFRQFWKKKRTNFWIIREKDRRTRRYNKARSQTRSGRLGQRKATKLQTVRVARVSVDMNSSFDKNAELSPTTLVHHPASAPMSDFQNELASRAAKNHNLELGLKTDNTLHPENIPGVYQDFVEGLDHHSDKSGMNSEADDDEPEPKPAELCKEISVIIPEEVEEIPVPPPRRIKGNAAQEVQLKDARPFRRKAKIVQNLPKIPDWAVLPLDKEQSNYDVTRTTFNQNNPFGGTSRLSDITQCQLMRGKEMLFQRFGSIPTHNSRPFSQGSIGVWSSTPSVPTRRPET